jgi:hypothetical protein
MKRQGVRCLHEGVNVKGLQFEVKVPAGETAKPPFLPQDNALKNGAGWSD